MSGERSQSSALSLHLWHQSQEVRQLRPDRSDQAARKGSGLFPPPLRSGSSLNLSSPGLAQFHPPQSPSFALASGKQSRTAHFPDKHCYLCHLFQDHIRRREHLRSSSEQLDNSSESWAHTVTLGGEGGPSHLAKITDLQSKRNAASTQGQGSFDTAQTLSTCRSHGKMSETYSPGRS